MQKMYLLWIFLHFIIEGATQPPTWTEPASPSISKASTECGDVTTLSADSGDGSSVIYTLVSETPTGGGFTITDHFSGNKILTCVQGSITEASYEVVVRAKHDGGNGLQADFTLTITFTDVASVPGPAWTSVNSYSLDKGDCTACGAVAALSATSTDSTSVTFSFVSQSPDGGFSVSGSTLSCTIASLSVSLYSVVVRAQNTGNNATTDQTLTITVTDSTSGGPIWSTGSTHSLNQDDSTACDAVTALSATSSDCTAVSYSLVSESPSGGFSVTGSTLSCDLASISASSYTVFIRANNTGDGEPTDLELTISVTSGSSDSNSNNGNNGREYVIAFSVAGGCAAVAGGGFGAYKVYRKKKKNQPVCPETITMKPKNDSEIPKLNIDEKTDDNTSPAEAKTV
ncbi:uncharacterized protein LOC128559603 [Mercenaria mercenaria]|uniref:uncharacterized protein LOC128559603 n=1 Tax=Mercenaria mercenaria TaxID=6596 RepID=UPI00234E856B|nr:uncharacterized protein LOC128559603 [Mercenaria mercenaria]XP_053407774.1 uncharacterized protein LOC128559603 [Mercenaria mercenaria]